MYRILVVDEQSLILFGYRQLLSGQRDCSICGEASNREAALEIAASHKPHLVIVDVFSGSIGFQLIEQLSRRYSPIRILVVSAMDAEFVSQRFLGAGVHGFVGKRDPCLQASRGDKLDQARATLFRWRLRGCKFESPAVQLEKRW